jgi:hypothetical protein
VWGDPSGLPHQHHPIWKEQTTELLLTFIALAAKPYAFASGEINIL